MYAVKPATTLDSWWDRDRSAWTVGFGPGSAFGDRQEAIAVVGRLEPGTAYVLELLPVS